MSVCGNVDELKADMIFLTGEGDIVRLERPRPGDGSAWLVSDWENGWVDNGASVEPADLLAEVAEPTPKTFFAQNAG